MALEHESQVYRSNLMTMLGVNEVNVGKYVVIRGDEILGIFPDYGAALEAGYRRCGLAPFLVRKLERNQTVMFLSREIR